MIPYLTPGGSFTAAEWNTLFTAQDALLTQYLGGLSPLLTGFSNCNTRKFFFFNPVTIDYTALHPLATAAFASMSITNGFRRSYNHSAITTALDALAVDTGNPPATSSVMAAVRLVAPTGAGLTSWNSAVYPEGGTPLFNPDACLSVYTRSGNAACFSSVTSTTNGFTEHEVERVHVWDEIDLIVNAGLSFPDTWNKYNLFCVHNFGQASVTVTFGSGASVTVPSGECRCIRRTAAGGVYSSGLNYFNYMAAGDPRISRLVGAATDMGSPFSPMLSDWRSSDVFFINPSTGLPDYRYLRLDLTQYWDMSSLYSSKLAAPSLSSLIGDLLVAKGNYASLVSGVATLVPFTGFTALGTALSASAHDFVDVGTNLISFLTGSVRAASPVSLSITGSFPNRTRRLAASSSTTNFTHYLYTLDGSGFYHAGSAVVQTLTQQVVAYDATDTTWYLGFSFSLTDTPQTIATYLANSNGSVCVLSNFRVLITPYGPALIWEENYTVQPGLDPSLLDLVTNTLRVIMSGNTLTVWRGVLLGPLIGHNCFPPNDNSNPEAWHFPRYARRYAALRNVTHNGALEPWQNMVTSGTAMVPTLTSNTSASPIVIDRGGVVSSSYEAWYAFDGNNTTMWVPSSPSQGWIQVKFGSAQTPGSYYVLQRYSNSWVLAGSNDGTTWTTVDTNAGTLSGTFPISTNTPYLYWRITFGGNGMEVYTIQFYNWSYITQEPPNIKRFFETTPIADEAPEATAAANTLLQQSRLGPVDTFGPLIYGLAGSDPSGILFSNFLAGGGTDSAAYARAFGIGSSVPNSAECTLVSGQTAQSPLFIEHYNMVASQTNGIVGTARKYGGGAGAGSIANNNWLPQFGNNFALLPTATDGSGTVTGAVTYFPRGAFCSWIAPATGTDTMAAYFTGQGIAIQNTLPDGYGHAIPDGSGGYLDGFTPDLQAVCARYKWIAIDDMRQLYDKFNVPMIIPAQIFIPLKFEVVTASLSSSLEFVAATQTVSVYTALPAYSYAAPVSNYGGVPGSPYGSLPSSDSQTQFTIDMGGGFLCSTGNSFNILEEDPRYGTPSVAYKVDYIISAVSGVPYSWTFTQTTLQTPYCYAAWESWNMWWVVIPGGGFNLRATTPRAPMCYVILAENSDSQMFSIIPQNYADWDWGFLRGENLYVSTVVGAITPKIIYNTEESSGWVETTYVNGSGGLGAYETVVTTSKSCATLSMIPVDQYIPPPIPPSTGAGSSGGGAGGGSPGGL